MTDLVTGGSGFIGRHLVRLLHERGRNVRVLDLDPGNGFPPGVEVIRGSVADEMIVSEALIGVHNLYHLAGNPELWAPTAADFEINNYTGTRTILQKAARCNLNRIIFTSTESILAACKGSRLRGFVDESAEGVIDDMPGPYCRSKFLAEQAALEAARNGQPVVIVNPTLPIGPGDRRLTPPSRMILGFLNGQYPAYLECNLNLIDVRDVATGHILAAERGRIGERYILGNQNMRLSTLLALVEEITGARMPRLKVPYLVALAVAAVDEFLAHTITGRIPAAPLTGVRLAKRPVLFNSSKATQELGLPLRPIKDSLRNAITWMMAQGLVQRRMPKFTADSSTALDQTAL
jgi:dihydroflavonol-4-reductase